MKIRGQPKHGYYATGSGVECKEIVTAFKDQKLGLKRCNL